MKSQIMRSYLMLALMLLPCTLYAADPLNGTLWKTIDDKTQQPRAIVKFTESPTGNLIATIQKVLISNEGQKCSNCVGTYHNQPLIGLTIIKNLKPIAPNKYDNGSILDPKSGKTYSFNATLSADKQTLSGRGYIGFSALGRSQTWYRVS